MEKIIRMTLVYKDGKTKILRLVDNNGVRSNLFDDYSPELYSKYLKEHIEQLKVLEESKTSVIEPKVEEKVESETKETDEVKEETKEEILEDVDINDYFIIKHKKAILRLVKIGLIGYATYKIVSPMYADFDSMPSPVIMEEQNEESKTYDVSEYYANLALENEKVR